MSNNPILEMMQAIVGTVPGDNLPTPVGRWLKGKLVKAELGNVAFEYTIREDWGNPAGFLHGGMFATLIDDTMGATTFSLGGQQFHSTVNLNIDYLSSVKVGDALRIEAKVERAGKRLINLSCEAHVGDKLVARASSNQIVINLTPEQPKG